MYIKKYVNRLNPSFRMTKVKSIALLQAFFIKQFICHCCWEQQFNYVQYIMHFNMGQHMAMVMSRLVDTATVNFLDTSTSTLLDCAGYFPLPLRTHFKRVEVGFEVGHLGI